MSEDASQKSAAANNENRARPALPKTVGETDESLVQPDFTPTSSYNSQAFAPEDATTVEDARVESQRKESAWVSSARPEFGDPDSGHAATSLSETDFPETPYPGTRDTAGSDLRGDPSRKVETPDMLRWRAEMLLDEMMVGAVDASAGDGAPANWRTSLLHADPPLPLDDRPRKVQITTPASSFGAAKPGPSAGDSFDIKSHADNGHAANGHAADVAGRAATDPSGADTHDLSGDVTGYSATEGVRAALPKPSTPRTATVLTGNGTAHNGTVHNVAAYSDGGATGYATARDAVDDGRPSGVNRMQNSAPGNGIAARSVPYNPAARSTGKSPQRLDGKQTGAAQYAPQYELQPDASARPQAVQPSATQQSAPQPSAAQPSSASSRLATPAPSVDPLEGPNTWEPIAPRTPAPPVNPITGRSPTRTNGSANATGNGAPKGKKLVAVEQRYPKAIPSNGPANAAGRRGYPASGTHNNDSAVNDDTWEFGLGPVRLNPAVVNGSSVTGAMAVNRASSRYASLLPRATPWDLHEMEREIVSLQEEMARVLPSGHESSRRARHLLEKAHTIFASDPMRSAEVDYYLTQVRSIVQRSRQTMQWSNLYRQQLNRYHLAWVGFSLLFLVLSVFYADRVSSWATFFFGWSEDGLSAAFVAPALISMFAGSLGGAIGALFTIRRYHQKDMGFFDRKYSLRGLMLPVIGFVGGMSLFAVFVTLYWAVGTTVPLPALLALLPACAAFLFGLLQENIYGTRD